MDSEQFRQPWVAVVLSYVVCKAQREAALRHFGSPNKILGIGVFDAPVVHV